MSQTNSAAALQQPNQQQQQQQQQQFQTSADNLISNAFDLIGGVSAAQQFINHMDLYAQHQRQLQQQQEQQQQQQQQQQHQQAQQQLNNYTYQQQHQRLFLNSIGESTLSTSTSISSSSGSQSPPSHLIQQQQQQHYQQQYNHHHHQQQQQQQQYHQQQQQQQQQLPRQHSISLTSSRNVSPTNFNTQLQQHQQQQQFQYYKMSHNLLNNQNHQMDIEPQQNGTTPTSTEVQLAGIDAALTTTTTTTKISSTTTPSVSVVVTSADSAVSSTNANNGTMTTTTTNTNAVQQQQHHQQQQQQQHHHHQHHQHGGDASPYKSCWCYGETTYHMKILVPAVASGAIIGKGGETIASLQKDSGARVKMSKSHDFYPGTTERVCLITGSVDGIMSVVDFIMDKIREKPDLTAKVMDGESKQQQERDKQVKILVPNSTAGMIIGKGGAFIKQIKEESGSYVQISQKPKDISLQERCITIIGDKENNKNACKMILSKIVEDPQSGTCLNVSYADVNGPVANFNPTGSPYATNQNAINTSTASLNSTLSSAISGAATAHGLLVNGTGVNLSLNLGAPNPAPNLALATQLLEHIKVALRGSGYSETATTEICAALGVLAKYGVLGMGVGMAHTANGAHAALSSYLGVSALDQQSAAAASAASASNMFGAVGQVNLDQYTAAMAAAANRQSQSLEAATVAQFDPYRLSSATAQASTPVSLNNNSFGLTGATGASGGAGGQALVATSVSSLGGLSKSPTPGDICAKDSKHIEINENIIGALLGPNGRSLVEIQHVSGANVQISKKGIFAPGTRNRIVTITGQPSAIAKAQFLIEQKINEEETKRARQIPHTTVVN